MIGIVIIYIIPFTMCNCCTTTDFRNTCWIKKPGFKNCPMIIHSILLRLFEDYQLNKKIRTQGFDSIKGYVMDICDLNDREWESLHNSFINNGNVCNAIEIQNSVPFQYTPEMTNINLRWLH
jgi:hypothetical protein